MIRFLARLFGSDDQPRSTGVGIVLASDSPPIGGVWRAAANAWVEIEGRISVVNTARYPVEILHLDVGVPGSVGDPPDVRARFASCEAPPVRTIPLEFSVHASPHFPIDGEWLYADVILLVDEGRRHRIPDVKFRRAKAA